MKRFRPYIVYIFLIIIKSLVDLAMFVNPYVKFFPLTLVVISNIQKGFKVSPAESINEMYLMLELI